ncbi:MAG: LamG domain-containing protein [Candidatus Nanohaloarchaea archaeon]|nr:LamG domain-containing protein [Candidatus Nanohaloarchaea archaeon]
MTLLLATTVLGGTTFTLTDQQDFLNGSLVNVDPDGSPGDLKLGTPNSSNSSLVAFYRFNNAVSGSGGTVQDYSGNNNDGTTKNGTTTGVKGIRGSQAFSFDGSDDYITMGPAPQTEINTFVSLSAWVKPDSLPSKFRIIAGRAQAGNEQYDLRTCGSSKCGDDGSLIFLVRDESGYYTADSGITSTGQWVHLVGVFDSEDKEARIYANGKLKDIVQTTYAHLNPSSNYFTVGGRTNSGSWADFFDGKIDKVRVYSRALTQTEIQQLYNPSPGYFTSSLLNGGGAPWINMS